MSSEKEISDIEENREKFKKSKFSKVLLIFFALAILLAFSNSKIIVKILTFIQAGLFISSWLMGMKFINEPLKGFRVILAIFAFVLIVPIINTGSQKEKYKKINWEYIVLQDHLPKPNENMGKIIINSDDYLSVCIRANSEDDYREYIELCKEFGYIIDAKNDTISYTANNEDGYNLRIWFSEYNKEYSIYLEKNLNEKNEGSQNENIIEDKKDEKQIENIIEERKEEAQNENVIEDNNTHNEISQNIISNNTYIEETKEPKNQIKYNYYTTNDDQTAKNGTKGKYSYIDKGKAYNIYWLIDFDEGYVYDFTDGNEDDTCEKIKIKSGDLNQGLELLYKNSSNAWVKYIHFKYANQPYKLVIVDNDYFTYEYETTSLEDTLKLMKNKTIYEP